jgi:maleylacetoacetate isomerase
MQLYTFWRSLATYRVRVALNLKGFSAEPVYVDLIKGDQRQDAFQSVNPAMALPALVPDEGGPPLFQSLAIIEYLNETHPRPPLLPPEPRARARVRALSQIVAADTHPLMVPRIRNFLGEEFKFDEAQRNRWIVHWQNEGLRALEGHLARDAETGRYCHGDFVTMADLCLVSQAIGAKLFNVDLTQFPTVSRIATTCLDEPAFADAHPLRQPDAPKEGAH